MSTSTVSSRTQSWFASVVSKITTKTWEPFEKQIKEVLAFTYNSQFFVFLFTQRLLFSASSAPFENCLCRMVAAAQLDCTWRPLSTTYILIIVFSRSPLQFPIFAITVNHADHKSRTVTQTVFNVLRIHSHKILAYRQFRFALNFTFISCSCSIFGP